MFVCVLCIHRKQKSEQTYDKGQTLMQSIYKLISLYAMCAPMWKIYIRKTFCSYSTLYIALENILFCVCVCVYNKDIYNIIIGKIILY